MKVTRLILVGFVTFLMSTFIFAGCCGGPAVGYSCHNNNCPVYESEYESACQCSDINCGTNPCLSRAKCCEAFGNVGAR